MNVLACWKFTVTPCVTTKTRSRNWKNKLCCKQINAINGDYNHSNNKEDSNVKKVVVVGSGWAGLGAANHLCNQGFDVTVLEDSNDFGGVDGVGLQGFWYPYRNIFSLVEELELKPFTNWTKSAQYSTEGLEVEFPVFQDMPQLPTPFGTLFYSQFARAPLVDRLTSLPLMVAVIYFDNSDTAWRKYDSITARELFKQFGLSGRLYRDIFGPLLHVGLFSPAEQCSAAATLQMLYYVSLAHQKDFDMRWCREMVKESIFDPWIDSMKTKGCTFLSNKQVTDLVVNEDDGLVSEVVCNTRTFEADAVVFALRVSMLQELIKNSAALYTREEFLKVLNLAGIDVVTTRLELDRKVTIPNAVNACAGFDGSFAWTFFDLNKIQDAYKDSPTTIVRVDFHHANELLPLTDEQLVEKAMAYLSRCINEFDKASVVEKEVARFPKSLTHFFPGSYQYMMRGSTSIPNVFMAGDWVINRHGSCSQEKSYITGLEAANRVVDYFGEGSFAKIIPVEEDEPHVQALRSLNRSLNEAISQLPLSDFFLQ